MLKLAAEPELRARLGKAARQRVRTHFSWDNKGTRLDEVYRVLFSMSSNARFGGLLPCDHKNL
jgi:glycosyltransferase involved in cell wall biosynthesis